MKKSTKIALIVAGACIAFGAMLFFFGLLFVRFDLSYVNSQRFLESTFEVDKEFDSISVKDMECDVRIVASTDGECRVECINSDRIFTTVEVEDGVLTVERKDERRWYECIGIWWNYEPTLYIYLPQSEYTSLYVHTVSGDIDVPSDFTFADVSVYSTSGGISVVCHTLEGLTVESTSGDVAVRNAEGGSFKVKTTSGDMEISDVTASEFFVNTTSGDVEIYKATSDGMMKVSSVSGDIDMKRADAAELLLDSVSGDINAILLSAKDFVTDTTSGDVNVPHPDTNAGKCSASTTSGDIYIRIE